MTGTASHDVALVIADLGPGGAQRVLTMLANGWAARGTSVCVVTLARPETDFYQLSPAITRLSVGGTGESTGLVRALFANATRVRQLRAALKQAEAPVVVSFVAAMNVLAILAGIATPWRTVISERNDPARQKLGLFWGPLRRCSYRFADLVTANSSAAVTALQKFVPAHKLRLVRNPIDLEAFTGSVEENRSGGTILTIGRLTEQKAHDIVLRAFANLDEARGAWRLTIVGEGPLDTELHSLAARLGVADRVDWRHRVTNVAALYRSCDVFVLASRYEGLPNVVLEAMAANRAIIVSDATAGALDYITDGETGFVVPVDEVEAFSSSLSQMTNDPALRERLGTAARQRVTSDELPRVLDEWSEMLKLPVLA